MKTPRTALAVVLSTNENVLLTQDNSPDFHTKYANYQTCDNEQCIDAFGRYWFSWYEFKDWDQILNPEFIPIIH